MGKSFERVLTRSVDHSRFMVDFDRPIKDPQNDVEKEGQLKLLKRYPVDPPHEGKLFKKVLTRLSILPFTLEFDWPIQRPVQGPQNGAGNVWLLKTSKKVFIRLTQKEWDRLKAFLKC